MYIYIDIHTHIILYHITLYYSIAYCIICRGGPGGAPGPGTRPTPTRPAHTII